MKFTLTEGVHDCTIVACSLNKPTDLPEDALRVFDMLPKNQAKTLIVPVSERFETAAFRQAIHRHGVTRLLSVGGSRKLLRTFEIAQQQHFADRQAFFDAFRGEDFGKENILIFDEVEPLSYLLEKKNRVTVLEVSLDALAHNIRYFRSKLQPDVKLMALVKAFSYGAGAYEVACLMQQLGVEYLGVAASDEGVQLREAGITLPIVVLTPEVDDVLPMVQYNLEPELHSFSSLARFAEAVKRLSLADYPVHIKIDTGMHRQGFEEHELAHLINVLKKSKSIRVASCFTHLSASDEAQHDEFTRRQLADFERISLQLQAQLGYPLIRHALNSAGIERFPEGQLDMARLGIGMYGGSGVSADGTQAVSTLRSVITQIKEVVPEETVGYGRRGKLSKPTRIAVVPIGYADGLNRRLGNGNGRFVINGQSAPIVGTICMDLTMVDITGLKAEEGDEVIIFGSEPSTFELAEKLGTITYEILTSVAARVKRVYTMSGELLG